MSAVMDSAPAVEVKKPEVAETTRYGSNWHLVKVADAVSVGTGMITFHRSPLMGRRWQPFNLGSSEPILLELAAQGLVQYVLLGETSKNQTRLPVLESYRDWHVYELMDWWAAYRVVVRHVEDEKRRRIKRSARVTILRQLDTQSYKVAEGYVTGYLMQLNRLQVDRQASICFADLPPVDRHGKNWSHYEMTVPMDEGWYDHHFPDGPVMPAAVQIDMAVHALGLALNRDLLEWPQLCRLESWQALSPVLPGDRLAASCRIEHQAIVEDRPTATGTAYLYRKEEEGRKIRVAKGRLTVRLI